MINNDNFEFTQFQMNNEFVRMVNHLHHLNFEHRSSQIYPIDPKLEEKIITKNTHTQSDYFTIE
jgi:hypothetical protein